MKDLHKLEFGYLLNQLISIFHKPQQGFLVSIQYLIVPVIIFVSFGLLLIMIRKALAMRNLLNELSMLLELTPPTFTEKQSYTTDQLFSIIHALGNQRSFKDKLLGNKPRFSLEIVSTQSQGIRYLVRTSPKYVNTLKKSLLAYLPYLKVVAVNEYLPEDTNSLSKYFYKIIEFKLSKHFAFSLKRQGDLDIHDPIAYLTGQMTKLKPGELISLQLIVSPVRSNGHKKISELISSNGDVIKYLNTPGILKWIFYNSYRIPKTKSPSEQEIVNSIDSKINQPWFSSTVRLLIISRDKNDLHEREQGFKSSFSTFSSTGYQSLTAKNFLNLNRMKTYLFMTFKKRILSPTKTSTLSISEISDIYHFPYTSMTNTENLVKSHSKTLPAPLSLKQGNKLDVTFGRNNYGGTDTLIGLTLQERYRHMYILGATGTGKSTLVLSMVIQDIAKGKGLCLIDPHGDLGTIILNSIPRQREKDLVYFDPFDIAYPIRINLLEMTPGLSENEQELEKELICESVISIFRKLFQKELSSADNNAYRIEHIFRNAIYTALTTDNPTIFTVFDLLVNPEFRNPVVKSLNNKRLQEFWKNEFSKAGDFQRIKMITPVTARIERFLFSPIARRILENKKSTISIDKIMDEGKILICNFSKGKLGEDNAQLLGTMILAKIQLAALKRARQEVADRKDFLVYVDEFQNFATKSFVEMLAESRKYGIYLTIVEQSTSQQRDRNLVNIILANVGTLICFKNANPEDEQILLPIFKPNLSQGEMSNLPIHHFYIKISAINPEEPFSGETIYPKINIDKQRVEELKQFSRDTYGSVYQKEAEKKDPSEENQDKSKVQMPESQKEQSNYTPVYGKINHKKGKSEIAKSPEKKVKEIRLPEDQVQVI